MDLNTITAVARPRSRAELPVWTAGDAWLAGGTWLFSEPQVSLTPVGRSAALLIGSVASVGAFLLTVTASTRRPVRLSFAKMPTPKELREAILLRITDDLYHDDVHGKPAWRKHMTLRLAEDI